MVLPNQRWRRICPMHRPLSARPRLPASTSLDIDGKRIEIAVRHSRRARHYRLTVEVRTGPVLTVPGGGRWREATAFLDRQRDWLAQRLAVQPPRVAFADGAEIPLRGVTHAVVATGEGQGGVRVGAGPALEVGGAVARLAARLTGWLKEEARADLAGAVRMHAARLGVAPAGLSVRDQASRWGSCSSTGRLSFNWRLVMAPPHVLDYVAAHEVAHLIEMSHSPRFWAALECTLPDMARGRAWLKENGRALHAYGG